MAVSRQRAKQLEYVSQGRCYRCGAPRQHYAVECDACHGKVMAARRQRLGQKAWRPGSRGRKPLIEVA